eukprot:5041415-Heterocapsa_arctica.AAC.1
MAGTPETVLHQGRSDLFEAIVDDWEATKEGGETTPFGQADVENIHQKHRNTGDTLYSRRTRSA